MSNTKNNPQQGSDGTYFPYGMGTGKQTVKESSKEGIAGYFNTGVENGADKYSEAAHGLPEALFGFLCTKL